MAHILCIFGLLCFVLNTVENAGIKEGFENLQLQQDELPSLRKVHDDLESTKEEDLIGLIQKLSKFEDETSYQDSEDTAKQETRQEKNRREEQSGLTTRKACRVFYWKTWASC